MKKIGIQQRSSYAKNDEQVIVGGWESTEKHVQASSIEIYQTGP